MIRLRQLVERKIRDIRDVYFRRYRNEKLPDKIFGYNRHLSISFCTTCMNRLFHLKKTYVQNIKDNIDYPAVEFVLVNYNSQDGLHEWAIKNLKEYIDRGLVNYYYTDAPEVFHASIAKNLAHKVATGDVVCNLDADNFTGKDFAFYINHEMQQEGLSTLIQFKKAPYWGTEGRIVLSKKRFFELGGYDEALAPIGHEDHDLMDRAKAYGLKYKNVQIENFLHYLSNTTFEKAVNVSKDSVRYYDLESANRELSEKNIQLNKLRANEHGWGMIPLMKNFSPEKKVY